MKKLFSVSLLFFIAFSLNSQCPATLQVTNSNGLNSNQLKLEFDSNTTPDSSTSISLDFGATDSRSGHYQVILSGRTWETLPQNNEHFKGNLDLFVTTDNSLCNYENGLLTPEPVCYKDSKWYGSCDKSKPIWRTGNIHIGQNNSTVYKLDVHGHTRADGNLTIEGGTGLGIMTTTEREAYDNSRDGILVYDSDTKGVYISTDGTWLRVPTNSSTGNHSFSDGSVAMIAVAGQSNAQGVSNNPDDAILPTSLPNVFVMATAARVWTNFDLSPNNNNVYRSNQTQYPNPLNSIAKAWQDRITIDGEDLPDLYILNVSKGGEAFSYNVTNGRCLWNPFAFTQDQISTWPNQLPDGQFDSGIDNEVSLFNLLDEALRAGVRELLQDGKEVMYMGTVWSQWESDGNTVATANQYATNIRLLRHMIDNAVGIQDANFFYYYPLTTTISQKQIIIDTFEKFEDNENNVFRVDLSESISIPPQNVSDLLISDQLHYTLDAQTWGAEHILSMMLDGIFIAKPAQLPSTF